MRYSSRPFHGVEFGVHAAVLIKERVQAAVLRLVEQRVEPRLRGGGRAREDRRRHEIDGAIMSGFCSPSIVGPIRHVVHLSTPSP